MGGFESSGFLIQDVEEWQRTAMSMYNIDVNVILIFEIEFRVGLARIDKNYL